MFLGVEVFDDRLDYEPDVAKAKNTCCRSDTLFDLCRGSRRESPFAHGFAQAAIHLFESPSNGFRNRVENFYWMPAASGHLSDSGAHSPCTDDPDHCIRRDRLFGRELGSRECCDHAAVSRARPRSRRRPSAFAHAFVERASLARPTLSIERKLRRTSCPRKRRNGVVEYCYIAFMSP